MAQMADAFNIEFEKYEKSVKAEVKIKIATIDKL
jgi:hypothetical protein